jgi:hypothetical protein
VQRADSIVETVAQRREGLASVTHQLQQLDSVIGYLSANLGRSGPTPLGRTFDLSSQPGAYALSSTGNPSEYASIVNGEFALWQYNRIRSDLYAEYIQRKKDLENYPSYLSVVGHPAVNYDKARPNRVVVTLLCFVAGLLFSSMGVLVADRFLGQRTS